MGFSSHINLTEILSLFDIIVFISILGLTIGVVLWSCFREKVKNKKKYFFDYMLMGRSLTLPLFIATLVATWYGGVFGVTEIAFESGLYNFLIQGIFWYVTYFLFAFFLVRRIKAYEAVTLPELAGKMFGKKARIIAAVFNFFNVVPVTYAISLGLLIKILTGMGFLESTLLGVSFASFYSLFGGFRAVVLSDVVQFFVMCSAVLLVLIFSFFSFGSEILFERLPSSHFSFMGKNSFLTTFVWGFIALSTLVDPNFYQRCFAAKNSETARTGILLAIVIWFFFDLCTTFGAMYARALIPEAVPSEAYLIYSLQLLPSGLRGFFLAGIVATILSTIDSYLFISSNTLSYDLGPAKWKESLFFNKLSLFFTGLFSIFLAVAFSGSIKLVWKTLGSYSAGSLLVPMLLGYWRKELISDELFTVSTLSSAVLMTSWSFWGLSDLDSLYIGLLTSVFVLSLGQIKISKQERRKEVKQSF